MVSIQQCNGKKHNHENDDGIQDAGGTVTRKKTFSRVSPRNDIVTAPTTKNRRSIAQGRNHAQTMEGLISNANKVLDYAMRPGLKGVHCGHFRTCAGICIISSVQVGYVLSGSMGSGIFMKHNFDNTWSNPVAVGITTVGLGMTVGATVKDALIFMTDFETVEAFFKTGVRLGGRASLTLGPVGRSAEGHIGASRAGTAATVTISYSRGADIGFSFDGGIVGPRHSINAEFYGNEHNNDPSGIVNGTISFPSNKDTEFSELKTKLILKSSKKYPNESIRQQNHTPIQRRLRSSPRRAQHHSLSPTESNITQDDVSSDGISVFVPRSSIRRRSIHSIRQKHVNFMTNDGLYSDISPSNHFGNQFANTENIRNNNNTKHLLEEQREKRPLHQQYTNSELKQQQNQDPWKNDTHNGRFPNDDVSVDKSTSIDGTVGCFSLALQHDELPWGMRVWSLS